MSDDNDPLRVTDEDVERVLEGMVGRGLLIKFTENGETLYRLTPEGEAWAREQKRQVSGNTSDLNLRFRTH